ncbi:MAG: hypothetical protein APR62_12485 [Smithella sp. SDB]|nr:MAG: hypothetical protein APR62_12485 [Smithella sp. SDB]
MKDQSKIKQAMIQESASREYAESIINSVCEPLIVLDHYLRVITASRSFYEVFKVNPKETVGQLIYDLGDKQWDIPKLRELLERILPQKTTFNNYEVEHDFPTIGKRIMLLNARQIQRALGKEQIILLAIEDITEHKQLENILKKSEEFYRSVFNNASDGIVLLEKREGKITHVNPSAEKMLGYSIKESIGNKLQDIGFMSGMDDFQTIMQKLNENGITSYIDVSFATKSGQHINTDINITDKTTVLQCNIRDITERKRTEELLKQSEVKYRLLADNVHDVIFVLDMNLRYTYISPSVKILRGYEPGEVLNQQPIEQTLTPSSRNLAMRTFSEIMELEKSEHVENPMSRTLQLEMNRKDGSTVWTEVKLSFIRDESNQPVGIMGVTRDITERRQADEKLLQALEKLRKAFGSTVQVMVSAIEMRDPYTASHQFRVANLAYAIASKVGFSDDEIEGIRMAGFIHDIGKLSIPAEILSKPTKLTNIEFSLIKEHSRIGYEMLKDIESPWPMAQIVYQHHERMDGSGYPRNLKGDAILMDARIMAVADVVEAMASHRPYRAALGIEVALEEIEKNKGILYDDVVADACLKLFREKGYHLR